MGTEHTFLSSRGRRRVGFALPSGTRFLLLLALHTTFSHVHGRGQDCVTGRLLQLKITAASGSRAENLGVQLLEVIG